MSLSEGSLFLRTMRWDFPGAGLPAGGDSFGGVRGQTIFVDSLDHV
jgi:hypothetical protein